MFGFDVFKLQSEIDRIYNEHYSQAGNQTIHDFYRAVKRRIRRCMKVRELEIIRARFVRDSRREWTMQMVLFFAGRRWEITMKVPDLISDPECMIVEVVK